MAIRSSLKIDDRELKKFADRITEKYVTRYISAGNKAQKEIRRKYTLDWFLNESTTMADALCYTHKLKQSKGKAYLYFTSYVDMQKFEIANVGQQNIMPGLTHHNTCLTCNGIRVYMDCLENGHVQIITLVSLGMTVYSIGRTLTIIRECQCAIMYDLDFKKNGNLQ